MLLSVQSKLCATLLPSQQTARVESEVIHSKLPHTADKAISAMDQDFLSHPTLMAGQQTPPVVFHQITPGQMAIIESDFASFRFCKLLIHLRVESLYKLPLD